MIKTAETFSKTADQVNAIKLMGMPGISRLLLYGGSRSGKSYIIIYAIIIRAIKFAGSRHAILRYRFNHAKQSLWYDTIPKVFKECFPGLHYIDNKSDWFIELPNGSQIWLGGLDDKERTEKILGNEYCVDPDSRILTAGLEWKPARHINKDDELIAFPENLEGHQTLCPSIVENKIIQRAEKYKIITTQGDTIVSRNHSFVVYKDDRRHRNFRSLSWVKCSDLNVGDMIRFATKPWDIQNDKDAGWLAGILDGEGWSSEKSGNVGMAQNDGTILNKAVDLFNRYGIKYRKYGGKCRQILACGIWPALRLLGMTQPIRLNSRHVWENRRAFNTKNKDEHFAKVLRIEYLGEGDVIAFNTSSKTIIADGFLGHNCTIYFNEISQISYSSIVIAQTRLAQRTTLKNIAYFDCNPPSKQHWSYKIWMQGIHPETKEALSHKEMYASFKMNPEGNKQNIAEGYIENILASLTGSARTRFYEGNYGDEDLGLIFNNWRYGDFDNTLSFGYGLDFGFQAPDGMCKIAIDRKNMKIYADECIYKMGNSSEQLRQLIAIHAHRDNLIVADCADTRMIYELRQYFNMRPVNKGKWTVADALKMMQSYEIIITERSKNLASELDMYSWHDEKAGIPTGEDHLLDGIRYYWMEITDRQRTGIRRIN